jgi:hypothetical protein
MRTDVNIIDDLETKNATNVKEVFPAMRSLRLINGLEFCAAVRARDRGAIAVATVMVVDVYVNLIRGLGTLARGRSPCRPEDEGIVGFLRTNVAVDDSVFDLLEL